MSEYDDTIHIKAKDVVEGDVLWNGQEVTKAVLIADAFMKIEAGGVKYWPGKHQLIAVREVVTD